MQLNLVNWARQLTLVKWPMQLTLVKWPRQLTLAKWAMQFTLVKWPMQLTHLGEVELQGVISGEGDVEAAVEVLLQRVAVVVEEK